MLHSDGRVDDDVSQHEAPIESGWRRPKYVQAQADADALDEEMAPRPSAAERPYNDGWRMAKYVRACALNPDPDKPICAFYSWNPGEPWAGIVRGPFFCKSWRCPFGCAEHEAHVMFARLEEAFAAYPAHELVFVVLTLDSHFHKLDFAELDDVFKELRARLEWWRKRLRRQLGKQGLGDFFNRWVAVIEQHETGVPHVNLVMHCPEWAKWLETRRLARLRNGQTPRTARLIANTLDRRDEIDQVWFRMLNECGFGFASTAEQVRKKEEVLGYTASVARHADEMAGRVKRIHVEGEASAGKNKRRRRRRRCAHNPLRMLGELAKKRQLPTRAPKGFRRLRSGRGFLPPRQKGKKTGCVLHHGKTPDGYELVQAMTKTTDPQRALATALCIELERQRAWSERNARETGELATQITRQEREVKDLSIVARDGSEASQKQYVAALKRLGELKRTRRRSGVEKVHVPPDLLERFDLSPPRAPPEARPPPPGDPSPMSPQPLPGVA